MDEKFSFKSDQIKPINEFPNVAQKPQPTQPQQPIQNPLPKANNPTTKNPNTLIYITVAFGVLALITTTICIWLLVDKTKIANLETTENKPTTSEVENQEITAKTLGFFPKKIKNPASGVTYRLGVHRNNSDGNGVFGAYINTENTGVELYIYWEFVGAYYGVETNRADRQLAHISFEQPVADIALGESGQSVGGDVLLFLLQDGTVEYMPIVKALKNGQFESYGKMGGLTDIVKFYRTDAIDGNGDFSGYITTLAQKADGQIIDLQGFMRSATTEN